MTSRPFPGSTPLSAQTRGVVRNLLKMPVETLGHMQPNRGSLDTRKIERGDETSSGSELPPGLAFHTHILTCRPGSAVCGAAPPSSTDVRTFLKPKHPSQHIVFSQEGTYVMDKSRTFGCSVSEQRRLVSDVKEILRERSTAGEEATRKRYLERVNASGCMRVDYFGDLRDVRVRKV